MTHDEELTVYAWTTCVSLYVTLLNILCWSNTFDRVDSITEAFYNHMTHDDKLTVYARTTCVSLYVTLLNILCWSNTFNRVDSITNIFILCKAFRSYVMSNNKCDMSSSLQTFLQHSQTRVNTSIL